MAICKPLTKYAAKEEQNCMRNPKSNPTIKRTELQFCPPTVISAAKLLFIE